MTDTSHQNQVFREALPCGCPPAGSIFAKNLSVMRLTRSAKPTQKCFDSKAHQGLDPGDSDPCDFASCSFFFYPDGKSSSEAMLKLPKFKKHFHYVHFMVIGPHAGEGNFNKKSKHVNMYFYKNFDPVVNVSSTEPL